MSRPVRPLTDEGREALALVREAQEALERASEAYHAAYRERSRLALAAVREAGVTHQRVAEVLGCDQPYVTRLIRAVEEEQAS